jgi:hypothetical protein
MIAIRYRFGVLAAGICFAAAACAPALRGGAGCRLAIRPSDVIPIGGEQTDGHRRPDAHHGLDSDDRTDGDGSAEIDRFPFALRSTRLGSAGRAGAAGAGNVDTHHSQCHHKSRKAKPQRVKSV